MSKVTLWAIRILSIACGLVGGFNIRSNFALGVAFIALGTSIMALGYLYLALGVFK